MYTVTRTVLFPIINNALQNNLNLKRTSNQVIFNEVVKLAKIVFTFTLLFLYVYKF